MKINKNLMSRNHTQMKRTAKDIGYIVIHYVGALGDAKANTDYYKSTDVGASADFWVGHNGEIWQGNDYYNYYSWHCGGGRQSSEGGAFYEKCRNYNSVGIEMCVRKKNTRTMNATDTDWYFTDETVNATVELVQHLMKELNIGIDHVIRHFDVNGKYCPNPYVVHPGAWENFKKRLVSTGKDQPAKVTGTQATELTGITEKDAAKRILAIVTPIANKYGLFPSVAAAQTILESGYCTTDLAVNANNVCGMKCNLSGNTWPGSTWDGKSKYRKRTAEQTKTGKEYFVEAEFRKYPCIEDSIADRCAYLLGAKNGDKLRYDGIKECKNFTEQIQLIKNGGYATDVKYVDKITSIIRRFELNQNDVKERPEEDRRVIFRVQVGAYTNKDNAERMVALLASSGYGAFIDGKDGSYKVICGAFSFKENAEKRVKELISKGFESFIQ